MKALSNAFSEEIERRFNLKIVNEQLLPWGEFYWFELSPTNHQAQSSFSIVKIYAHCEQKIHPHPGYEEVVIGLEGELFHWCDDRKIELKKDQVGYIRSGGQHRIVNATDRPATFMSIVTPVMPPTFGELSQIDGVEFEELVDMIRLEPIT